MSKRFLYYGVKRLIDVVGGIVGLIVFFPITIWIVIRIKLEDGGPVLYKQIRVGKQGELFSMYKFRSMVVGAPSLKGKLVQQNESDGPIFKIKNDPRITKIGRFIRKHSLDEIPQFVNVIQGKMSLVGPRPALPEEVRRYSNYEIKRLETKPGLTGLWQVSGRSNLSFKKMIQLDIMYIDTMSLFVDLKILFKTVTQIFYSNNNGAY